MSWETAKPILRPEGVHMGVLEVDRGRCTRCGLCIKNCPFGSWEKDEDGYPRQREGYQCFTCLNCSVPCPANAISVVSPYHVDQGGFFETYPPDLRLEPPSQPLDAGGNPDEWTAIERLVMNRRSVRNFRDKAVPDHLIRRVLEAGRFAPSAGNSQPWRFVVVQDKAIIEEMNQVCYEGLKRYHDLYINDDAARQVLTAAIEADFSRPGNFDPRMVLGGIGAVVRKWTPVFLNAPVVVLLAADSRSIGGAEINIGICGQNMNLVANSLGLGSCWVSFSQTINGTPLAERLGLRPPWSIYSSVVLGYPKFKQSGVVAREMRPVTWFRAGGDGAEVEG